MQGYYPVYLNIKGKKCVIIGGGKVAYRKACSLKEAGADVHVVSPEICKEITEIKGITLARKNYDERILEGALLAIAATDNEAVNKKVASEANKRNMMVNIVDCPELCTFIVPSTVKRGSLCISISTGGASPALAKNIRKELEAKYGQEYEDYLNLLAKMRNIALSEIKDDTKRRNTLQRLADKNIIETIKAEGIEKAEEKMREMIEK